MCSKCRARENRAGQTFTITFVNLNGSDYDLHMAGDMPMPTVREQLVETLEALDLAQQSDADDQARVDKITSAYDQAAEGEKVDAVIAAMIDDLNEGAPEGAEITLVNNSVVLKWEGKEVGQVDLSNLDDTNNAKDAGDVMTAVAARFAAMLTAQMAAEGVKA